MFLEISVFVITLYAEAIPPPPPAHIAAFCIFFMWIGIWSAPRFDGVAPTGGLTPAGACLNPAAGCITGLRLSTYADTWAPKYVTTTIKGVPDPKGDKVWTFPDLVGLFFPAVTGIMVGSNRAAFLKDPHDGIVRGTLAAHVFTTSIYLITVIFFGGAATSAYLLNNRYLSADISLPSSTLVSVGIFISAFSAALQTQVRLSPSVSSFVSLRFSRAYVVSPLGLSRSLWHLALSGLGPPDSWSAALPPSVASLLPLPL